MSFGAHLSPPTPQSSVATHFTIESQLFGLGRPLDRDTTELCSSKTSRQSRITLYRKYHTHEVNSPCYPDPDQSVWDNSTKALSNYTKRSNEIR